MSQIITIKAEIPGTFYRQSSPDSPVFVEVGDAVKVGDTLALIEVMKMFNPVESTVTGTVLEILVANEDLIDVEQDLIRIELTDEVSA